MDRNRDYDVSDDEGSIGMRDRWRTFGRRFVRNTPRAPLLVPSAPTPPVNSQNSNSNNEDQLNALKNNMGEMVSSLNKMASDISNLQVGSSNAIRNDFSQPPPSLNPILSFGPQNYRYATTDIPVYRSNQRDLSPTGLSTIHARELLSSIEDHINKAKGLDRINKELLLDQTSQQIKQIFKAQNSENTYNAPHLKCNTFNNLEPPFLANRKNTYNADKLFQKQRVIHRQLMSIETVGLKAFLNQLDSFDLSDFSPCEYNMLIHMSISKEIKEKLEMAGGNPLDLPTSEYLNKLNRLLNGSITNMLDIDENFAKFKPSSKSIMSILYEYKRYIENISDAIISEKEKNRRIISAVYKYIPYGLRHFLNSTAAIQNGQITLAAFENFLRTHEASIDSFLSKESRVHKNVVKRVDVDWEQVDICAEDLYDHLSDDECNYGPQNVFKLNSYQNKASLKCDICKRIGHKNSQCIFNPNDSLRVANLQNVKIKFCLLCRDKAHTDTKCPNFPNVKPIPIACPNCQDAGFYMYNHPVDACVKNNFLEKLKRSEVNT